jgi:aromatic ring hydroxylase
MDESLRKSPRSQFGGSLRVNEIYCSGNHEQIRLNILTGAQKSGILAECLALTEKCMSDTT